MLACDGACLCTNSVTDSDHKPASQDFPPASFQTASQQQRSVHPRGDRHQKTASSSNHMEGLVHAGSSPLLPSVQGGTHCLMGCGEGGDLYFRGPVLGRVLVSRHRGKQIACSCSVNPNLVLLKHLLLCCCGAKERLHDGMQGYTLSTSN